MAVDGEGLSALRGMWKRCRTWLMTPPPRTHRLGQSIYIYIYIYIYRGLGSSVVTATDYGLDGPGSNPGGDEIFRPSRPALGPTQPPLQWVPGLSRG